MLKFIVIALVIAGAFFLSFLLWPGGVMATAFHVGQVAVPWLALILVAAVIIALKAK